MMEIIKYTKDIKALIAELKKSGKIIGFVPTMGALHEGHLSLVECSRKRDDYTITSIFVNPTQFNDKSDLSNYPRTVDKDLELLENAGCNMVFLPDEKEIYPSPDTRIFDFDGLDLVMEGKFRPGHFNGVAQVVTRFFDIVNPQRAYFGIKDFQQLAIIKHVVKKFRLPVEIVSCPIVRESNGLAMSSRNLRLSEKEKEIASNISKILFAVKDKVSDFKSVEQIMHFVDEQCELIPEIELEYFEIVNLSTLRPIEEMAGISDGIGCIAAWIGGIRLIDNVIFNS